MAIITPNNPAAVVVHSDMPQKQATISPVVERVANVTASHAINRSDTASEQQSTSMKLANRLDKQAKSNDKLRNSEKEVSKSQEAADELDLVLGIFSKLNDIADQAQEETDEDTLESLQEQYTALISELNQWNDGNNAVASEVEINTTSSPQTARSASLFYSEAEELEELEEGEVKVMYNADSISSVVETLSKMSLSKQQDLESVTSMLSGEGGVTQQLTGARSALTDSMNGEQLSASVLDTELANQYGIESKSQMTELEGAKKLTSTSTTPPLVVSILR